MKKIWKYKERRRNKRFPLNLNAEIKIQDDERDVSKKHLHPVKIINLSLQGCCIVTNIVMFNRKHLFRNDRGFKDIDILIHLPNNTIQTSARVVWYDREEKSRGFKVGLCFESMGEVERDLLEQYMKLGSK